MPKNKLKRGKTDTVDAYAKRLEPKRRGVFAKVRTLIRSDKRLSEGISWGNPSYWVMRKGKKVFSLWLYAYPRTDYINFGFFHGPSLKDPKKRVEGTGKAMRHIKIFGTKDIDAPYFKKLIKQEVSVSLKKGKA